MLRGLREDSHSGAGQIIQLCQHIRRFVTFAWDPLGFSRPSPGLKCGNGTNLRARVRARCGRIQTLDRFPVI
ncbi:hypothetical protein V6N11_054733 [Hibiscus sabdariffa]|uniref:Uncharacterized protein n=1 Tax=Hibiscus sabdariffa TaxID=183260 RepID=A0ABR2S5A5_9ROSI